VPGLLSHMQHAVWTAVRRSRHSARKREKSRTEAWGMGDGKRAERGEKESYSSLLWSSSKCVCATSQSDSLDKRFNGGLRLGLIGSVFHSLSNWAWFRVRNIGIQFVLSHATVATNFFMR